jgi:hypothetical protein
VGTLVAVVIQMVPVVESWHRLAMDSPLWRESEHILCLSCPPLLASREQERRTLKASEKRELRDGYQHKTKEIFIASEASRGYSNGCPFDSCAPTRVCHFKNRASCAGYPDGQANCLTFHRKVHRDMTAVQQKTCVADSSMCIEHIINPV